VQLVGIADEVGGRRVVVDWSILPEPLAPLVVVIGAETCLVVLVVLLRGE
jgi:hypothetical protein